MAQFDNDPTVVSLKARMKQLGVDLNPYIGQITHKWDSTPRGFGFTWIDDRAYGSLMRALVDSPKFGSDSMVGGSQHRGASFREINPLDSLHIVLSRTADPQSKARCTIHLDSVSPVKGIDPATRQVIYDHSKVLQHLATDLLHTPLIVPSGEKGIVFGFRF